MSSADMAIAAAVGFGGGILAGLFGISGGGIYVPGLVVFLGLEQAVAQGVALAAAVPIALVGSIVHYRNGHVDLLALAWMAPMAVLGGVLGASLAGVLAEDILRAVFAVVILMLGSRMLLSGLPCPLRWRRPRPATEVADGD